MAVDMALMQRGWRAASLRALQKRLYPPGYLELASDTDFGRVSAVAAGNADVSQSRRVAQAVIQRHNDSRDTRPGKRARASR
jgi:hypothetical protein